MKATPELLQKALRNLEIGLSPEISAKILATVRLLDEKGAEANLMDFALIEACYSEKPQDELLPSDSVDLSLLEVNDLVTLQNGLSEVIVSCFAYDSGNEFNVMTNAFHEKYNRKGECITTNHDTGEQQPELNIVKIIKPN